jgi:hypothetical protein
LLDQCGRGIGHGLHVEAIDQHAQEALEKDEHLEGAQAAVFDNRVDVESFVHELCTSVVVVFGNCRVEAQNRGELSSWG